MSSELNKLYQEQLLSNAKSPHNFGSISGCDRIAQGKNPACGDTITVGLSLKGGIVEYAGFEGESCAICKGVASILLRHIEGQSIAYSGSLCGSLLTLFKSWSDIDLPPDFAAVSALKPYTSRAKCMTLPVATSIAAINQTNELISTE